MGLEQIGLTAVLITTGFKQGAREYETIVNSITGKTEQVAKKLSIGAAATFDFKAALSSLVRAGAITYLVKGLKEVIQTTVDYQKEVKKFQLLSGMSWEDTSRLVAITEDLGVGSGDLEVALKMLSEKGYAPTLTTLEMVADKYLALNTAEDKNKYANDMLGKSYVDLLPLLALGGQGIADMAAGVNKGLLVENGKALQDYTDALNNFNAAKQAAVMGLGGALLPGASALMGFIPDLLDVKNIKDVVYAEEEMVIKFMQLEGVVKSLVGLGLLPKSFLTDMDLLEKEIPVVTGVIENGLIPAVHDLGTASKKNESPIGNIGGTIRTAGERGKTAAGKLMEMKGATDANALAAKDAYDPIKELADMVVNRQAYWNFYIRTYGHIPSGGGMEADYNYTDPYGNVIPEYLRAGGGYLDAGQSALVGERGPEMIVPRVPVDVIPNGEMSTYLNSMMPVWSRGAQPDMNIGLNNSQQNTTNNWNFRLSTMSGPQTIQRSYKTAKLLNG